MTAAYRFNPAFQSPQGSPIRELFKYTQQPGMISFAGGYPALLFDTQGLARAPPPCSTAQRQPACNMGDRRRGGAGAGAQQLTRAHRWPIRAS
jgi:hypothetical protein